jgi:peroxiredoxin
MDRREWLKLGGAGLLQAVTAPMWAAEDSAVQVMTLVGTDMNGAKLDLSDLRGKLVLVSFFTAGCALCTRDLKLMREFYVTNARRNFRLLGVNIDPDKSDFETYSQVIAMTIPKDQRFPMVWRNAPGHKDNFGPITRQPTHFVVNQDNELVFKREGTFEQDDWDNLAAGLPTKA